MIEILLVGFLIGFLGSAHCLGMCGGLVVATGTLNSLQTNNLQTKRAQYFKLLTYNFGRICSYSLMGLFAGFIGLELGNWYLGLVLPLRIVAGLMLIAMGCYIAGWWFGLRKLEQIGGRLFKPLQKKFSSALANNSFSGRFIAGLLWGYIPCGLVYSALTLALAKANPLESASLMFAFGVGTLPSIVLGTVLHNSIIQWLRIKSVRQGAGILLILAGLWTFISPQLFEFIGHHTEAVHDAAPEQHEHQVYSNPDHKTEMSGFVLTNNEVNI
ncbi:MAG: sulfite exporter TauE/SafE [Enterobacterales bacterium]|jgi:sulfite exporter TauE/SafE